MGLHKLWASQLKNFRPMQILDEYGKFKPARLRVAQIKDPENIEEQYSHLFRDWDEFKNTIKEQKGE